MRYLGLFTLILVLFLCNKKTTNTDVAQTPIPREGPVYVLKAPATEQVPAPLLSPGGVVYFDFDRYDLREDAAQAIVKMVLVEEVQVDGYCDERGTDDYNYELGLKRAETVAAVLRNRGVKTVVRSFGENGLVRSGCIDEDCHAENRRVEVHGK